MNDKRLKLWEAYHSTAPGLLMFMTFAAVLFALPGWALGWLWQRGNVTWIMRGETQHEFLAMANAIEVRKHQQREPICPSHAKEHSQEASVAWGRNRKRSGWQLRHLWLCLWGRRSIHRHVAEAIWFESNPKETILHGTDVILYLKHKRIQQSRKALPQPKRVSSSTSGFSASNNNCS